ncbi:MAG TPA: PRC-barrel domain-containing protein [Roseiarcus sp.]|nr:PRC-barrel domain-containing protein [Roseiarcus sp.]
MTAERRNVALRRRLIEVGSSRRLQGLSLSPVTTKMKGREAMPTFAASAQRALSVSRRDNKRAVALVALALLSAQQPSRAATRSSAQLPWRSAQAASSPQPAASPPSQQPAAAPPSPQPNAGAPTPQEDDKNKAEKAGVPATVVDGEQLESVLGIQALSSTGDDMGRIVDIIVDRGGQVRAAIIDFGGFLGVGSRKIAVDWRSLHFDPKKAGAVVVNLTKDQLRVAPVYKPAEPVVMVGGPSAKP